ncbi:MAG: MFS transporter [Bdellovibrionota bacterium]
MVPRKRLAVIGRLRLVRALSHRPVFVLWLGEALSAIGDEIYKVALIWLTVKLIGPDAGYLAACQAGAVLLFGLVGGLWADSWDPRRTMIRTDIARAVLVLAPVVWLQFWPVNLPLLFGMAIFVAALSAFFEPALQAVVPRLVANRELMQATNGLMGTTSRMARAVGPAVVGALTGLIPTIHFFTLDALSFGASAYAISSLRHDLPRIRGVRKNSNVWAEIRSGFELTRGDPLVRYILASKAIGSGAWNIVLPLGIALLVQKIFPGDVRAYGFLLASYGIGNIISALFLSNVTMHRPMRVMGLGFFLMGLSFACMALMPSLWLMMICLALAAVGGPMNDLAHIDIFQNRFPVEQLVRVTRFRMAIEYGGIFLSLLAAPVCFRIFSVMWVVVGAGAVIAVVGLWALLFYGE